MKRIYGIMSILCIFLIFFFSLQNATESYRVSSSTAEGFNAAVNMVVELNQWDTIRSVIWKNHRKIAHFLLYSGMGWCVVNYLKYFATKTQKYICIITLVLGGSIACIDETFQSHIPGRTGSLRDVGIDIGGILLSLLLFGFSCKISNWIRNRGMWNDYSVRK